MGKRARVFNGVQYEVNPKTLEDLNFGEENIKRCIEHKTIKKYAYIRHNRDRITQQDVDAGNAESEDIGRFKEAHWHFVFQTKDAVDVDMIAKWLDIPAHLIKIPKGKGAFYDCVEYLTHENVDEADGKFIYSADEVQANFDWQKELAVFKNKISSKDGALSQLRADVLYRGLRISELVALHEELYAKHQVEFDRLRMKYLMDYALLPATRVNFYIYGTAGVGKDTMARAIARAYVNSTNSEFTDEPFFQVGASNVTFQGYDGQPVVIWSDFRASTLVDALGGYENVLNAFDTLPNSALFHKKYGAVKLVNSINIVTATEDYRDFLQGLIPLNDPSPEQANRRFPIIIPVHAADFDIMINSGFLDQSHYREYRAWKGVKGSFAQLGRQLSARPALREIVETRLVAPVEEARQLVEKKFVGDEFDGMTDDEILATFSEYGSSREIM